MHMGIHAFGLTALWSLMFPSVLQDRGQPDTANRAGATHDAALGIVVARQWIWYSGVSVQSWLSKSLLISATHSHEVHKIRYRFPGNCVTSAACCGGGVTRFGTSQLLPGGVRDHRYCRTRLRLIRLPTAIELLEGLYDREN